YDGWGYSPLEQITTKNVQRLFPVWEFSTGMVSGHEAPPIVNNGVMFVATPGNQVIAIEAKTGKPLWRCRRPFAEGAIVPHPTSRAERRCGEPSACRRRESRAAKPGRREINGRMAEALFGCLSITIRRRTCFSWEPETGVPGSATSVRVTISTLRQQ